MGAVKEAIRSKKCRSRDRWVCYRELRDDKVEEDELEEMQFKRFKVGGQEFKVVMIRNQPVYGEVKDKDQTFIGTFKDRRPHKGTAKFKRPFMFNGKRGRVATGTFNKNFELTGQAKLTFFDGTKLNGEFRQNKLVSALSNGFHARKGSRTVAGVTAAVGDYRGSRY
jgi:hypothetical protein